MKSSSYKEIIMRLKTSVKISVVGENIERFLNICSHHDIKLYDIYKDENVYYASIDPACFFSLKTIAKKADVKIKIISKNGIFFRYLQLKKEYFFILFPIICILILWISSHFLWNVQLNGNISITQDMLRDYLHQNGIYYGMPLKKIPINELKSNIRNEYPQVNWVSVYLEGTTLQIAMKENDNKIYTSDNNEIQENIIAPVSGIVDSILTRKGTALVKPGDEVKEGDILILGSIDIPSEDGSTQNTVSCKADGDISIICNYTINESIPLKYTTKEYTQRKSKRLEIQINNKSYILPSSKVSYLNYDILSEAKEISIFSIFSLPIRIHSKTYYEYNNIENKYTSEQSHQILNLKLEKICETFLEKGVQIIEKNVKIKTNSVYSTMSGSLTLKVPCTNENISEDNP